MPRVSIVIPAHNEAENIVLLVKEIKKILDRNNISFETIVVDDNSTDDTSERILDMKKKMSNLVLIKRRDGKPGVGRNFREGFSKAKGDIIITMDADFSHDPNDLPRFVDAMKHADFVSGSRYMHGGSGELDLQRKIISRGYSFFCGLLLGIEMTDFSTGYRAISRKAVEKISLESDGFSIHSELPIKIHLKNFRIKEIPIHYKKRRKGFSKLKYMKEGKYYTGVLLYGVKQRIKRLFGINCD